MNMSSTTGFRPVAAAPTAAPMNAASEIGVSRTRSAPNSSYRPRVTAKMPPALPTSIPSKQTVGSIRNYDVMIERIEDSQAITYDGMPHNICDAAPERCVDDVLCFLRWRFGDA